MSKYSSEPSTRICEKCGKEYHPTSSNQKYCVSCRMANFLTRIKTIFEQDQNKKNNGKK